MKICLVTYCDTTFKIILSQFEKSKAEYCAKHNLDFYCSAVKFNQEFKLGWLKIDILLQYLKIYDYVYITDYDSVIIDNNYDVRKLIEKSDNADVICSELNGGFKLLGCSIFKSSDKIISFLTHIRLKYHNLKSNSFYAEEIPFNLLMNEFKIKTYVENDINYIYDIHQGTPKFIIHYAGVSNPMKIKKLYEKKFNNTRQ